MSEDINPKVYDDPNCQLGGDEVELEITRHKDRWHLNFAGDYYSIQTKSNPTQYAPLTVTRRESEEGKVNWLLSKDPLWWHFEPDTNVATPNPDTWGRLDFIRALSSWPIENLDDPMLTSIISGQYKGIALWLLLYELKASKEKEKLRSLLWTTKSLNCLLPDVEFCSAKREFARQVFPKVTLAQRADDEEYLWLAFEYSGCLQKNQSDWQSKTPWRKHSTQLIKAYRQALNKNVFDELLTIEQLQSEALDWRCHVLNLVMQDAIGHVFEYQDDELKRHCNLFVNAWERYNSVVGHTDTSQLQGA